MVGRCILNEANLVPTELAPNASSPKASPLWAQGPQRNATRDRDEFVRASLPDWLLAVKIGPEAGITDLWWNSSGSSLFGLLVQKNYHVGAFRFFASWNFGVGAGGFEPPTPALSRQCSTTELRACGAFEDRISVPGAAASTAVLLRCQAGVIRPSRDDPRQ